MRYDDAPAWLQAADAHAIAAENTSIFEDIGGAIVNGPSFLAVSIASGLNSFYNTGVAIGNIFEEEETKSQMRDTGEWISSYDDDLGKYYAEVKDGADITGFIAGSLIPGTIAVKGLNAAQKAAQVAAAGQVGTNMSRATGLLAPAMETFVKREAADLAARSASFSFIHQNSLKALGAGVQQGVLEGLAFETAVAATMFKSPILEDMDVGDIIKNGLFGVAIGGGVYGLIGAAQTRTGVGRLLQRVDQTQSIFSRSTQTLTSRATLPSDKIMNAAMDLEVLSKIEPSAEFVMAQKLAAGETGESLLPHHIAAEVEKLQRVRESNKLRLKDEIRTAARELTTKGKGKPDDVLGNSMVDIVDKLGPSGLQKLFFNSKQVVRAGDTSAFEQTVKTMVDNGIYKNAAEAKKGLQTSMVETHVRLHSGAIGEEIAGNVGIHRLADDLSTDAYKKLVDSHPFKPSAKVDFRTKVTSRDAELRWTGSRKAGIPFPKNYIFGSHDLPALEKAVREGLAEIKIDVGQGGTRVLSSPEEIKEYLVLAKGEVLQAQKDLGSSTDLIEVISDVRKDFIEGVNKGNDVDQAFFAQRSYAREASQFLGREVDEVTLAEMPRFAKVTYDTQTITDEAGKVMQGMELIKHREKLAKQATQNYFVNYAKELGEIFPDIPEDLLRTMWRGETGAGTFTNAGGSYGSMSSMASYIGDLVSELSRTKISALTENITRSAQRLLTQPEDAIRFSTINAMISNTPEKYVLDETFENLIPYKLKQWMDEGMEGDMPVLHPGSPEAIPLETAAVRDAVIKHIDLSTSRNVTRGELNAVQGNMDTKLSGVFRPIRPDARDFKHVAFVKDETLVGVGHTRMIFAKDGAELEDMISKVNAIGKYKVYTKQESENFFKARGEYEYDKTLHENYLDTDLLSRGISANFLPPTDPQKIVNQWLQHHVREENALLKQSVLVKYEKETNELKRLADQWDLANGSRVGSKTITETLTSPTKNPYTAMIKAMLNVTKVEENAAFTTLNQMLDEGISKVWNSAAQFLGKGVPTPEEINRINGVFEEFGFKSAYYDAATTLLANSQVPRGVLTSFVRKANAFLTTTILRLDAFNSINNLVGNSVLYSAEIKAVTDAIKLGSKVGAGELAGLANIKVPGVTDEIFSPGKLMANAIKRLHGPDAAKLIEQYKVRGLAPDLSDQYYKSLDAMTLNGMESVSDMSKKLAKLDESWEAFAKWGEKATGNKWAEQFNRLLAADTMKQITEVAVKNGLMDEKTAWAYVSMFSKRVNGVIRAAERPLMFQGPIGQAMGLFQSYQMNLIQQTFRHIGEGKGKVVGLMAGMQASVFGASSLPGFNLINTHLVGQASGNPEHYDLFSATQAIFGKTGSEWLMYGAPSNILRSSLYTRGDTNPRTWHVVPNPTNPSELPFISAFAKAFGSLKQATGQAADGKPIWDAFLGGVEHLGLSRPLAGIAQVARGIGNDGQVIATQRNGSIAGSNDFFTMASLIRVLGAKPIDEAITTNGYFRINAYAEKDRLRREKLGSTLKGIIMSGEEIGDDTVGEFARQYVEQGGKATGFNSWWMNQYKNATQTQAQQMIRKLDDPYSRRMMEVMGGRDSLNTLDNY